MGPPGELSPDCASCFALCCVALPFSRGPAFAEDKAAGTPCRHLADDDRCRIHRTLAASGWGGCVAFECFGAGQHVSQRTYAGRSWRTHPEDAGEMFAALGIVRQLHEMRFLLSDPACTESAYAAEAARLDAELEQVAAAPPAALLATDPAPLRARAGDLFARVAVERGGASHRGAWLMAADLRGADLTDADLLGADLRDADLRGADLARALFLTQPQLNGARGDDRTSIPARLARPAGWVG